MGYKVIKIDKDEWAKLYSEKAHLICFGTEKPAHFDRIDYALLIVDESNNIPAAYITCREYDHETVYWQFGGSMPRTRGTVGSLRCFDSAISFAKLTYKRVTFVVENTNEAMLKLALARDFLIVGTRSYHGAVLVEFMREFKEE